MTYTDYLKHIFNGHIPQQIDARENIILSESFKIIQGLQDEITGLENNESSAPLMLSTLNHINSKEGLLSRETLKLLKETIAHVTK